MTIDITQLRTGTRKGDGKDNKDGKSAAGIAIVRESQRHRFASVELVDEVIALDQAWCHLRFSLDKLRHDLNAAAKKIGKLKAAQDDEAANKLVEGTNDIKKRLTAMEAEEQEAKRALDTKLMAIGNILHASVPVAADEAANETLRVFGDRRTHQNNLMNHVDLCVALDIVDLKRGVAAAGGRGYYLTRQGATLNRALANFGIDFLQRRGYEEVRPPHMMTKAAMAKVAQLSQYDEELYKLEREDKYLPATSEQPLAYLHHGETFHASQLPIRYVGFSTCFRKEAGSHGRDTAGIFRTHEFDKVEQFCVTAPDGDASWEMHEEMIRNAEEFYRELGVAGRVVNVVSGELNDAAAKKYDLEAWFPASGTYRELVSCSNCTDYQARRLGMTCGGGGPGKGKGGERGKRFVHTLNSTLTATQRTLCCILETYQEEGGVRVPEVLRPYMCGIEFIPFKKPLPDRHGGGAGSPNQRETLNQKRSK